MHAGDRLENFREQAGPRPGGPVQLADHERVVGRLAQPARTEVARAHLDGPDDQPLARNDCRDPVVHEAVSECDVRLDDVARFERRQRHLERRRLQRDQGEVEVAIELRRARPGVDLHPAELAQPVELQARFAQTFDVLVICIQHDDVPNAPLHQRGGDAADRARADDEDPGLDYRESSPAGESSPPSNCTGGVSWSSSPRAAYRRSRSTRSRAAAPSG